ncbi:MAG: chromosome segregation protein SMC [Nitrospirota bacterium]
MRVDRLELTGFKSFAEKTKFNFHPGITCIVGPNGCGKSNIVDAFRWVLGEQSAKSLRGEKMEEVIFNGSASKRPKGMADVTMVVSGLYGNNPPTPPFSKGGQGGLSNENGEGISDVAYVTRRLYRSGDSEYLLNKSQCRLKDIKDLFLDTGLEVRSYSILEQDRIAEILNSKPQDRRFLIEEIAGVMKYNVRKKEAQAKLESSRANLQRINDIVIEVKKQINLLDRLAKKAERYKRLSSEIRSIELRIAKRDYQALKESFDVILTDYNTLKEEETLKKAELARIENLTEAKRLEILEKEKELEQILIKFQNLEREISEIEKGIAVARTERDNNNEYLSKLYQQEEEFSHREAEMLNRQKELDETGVTLLSEMESQKELLKEKNDFLRFMEEELLENENLLDEKRREIFRVSEELSNLRNNQNMLQSSIEGLKQREAASAKDADQLKTELSKIDISLKDMELNLLDKNNDLLLLNEKKEVLVNELSDSKGKIENIRENLSRLKEELASHTSRIDSLREIIFDRSTKELLSEDVSLNLLASISDVIEIEGEYEKAIESGLSEKVNSFILPSIRDIEIAVSVVKEKNLSRTAFIPVNPPKFPHTPLWERDNPPNPPLLKGGEGGFSEKTDIPEGTIGRALNFIRTKEEFSEIAKSLFENIFIVKDLKTALDLVVSGVNLFYVTLDGEVIEPSGTVIVGEVKGIFRRKREIRELESTTQNSRAMIERSEAELNSIQQLIQTKEGEIKDIESSIVIKEKEVSLLKLTDENYRDEKERKDRKLAHLTLEIEQIINEKESIERLISEKESEIKLIDSKKLELDRYGASLQEEISQKRAHLDECRAEVTDIRLSIASLKERIESVGKGKENINKEIMQNNQKKAFLSEEISSIKSRISHREAEMEEYEEKVRALISVADELKTEITNRKEVIENKNGELLSAEKGLKLIRNQIDSVLQRVAELDIHRAEHKLKMENLSENIKLNYGLEINAIEAESLTEEDEKRLIELREKVQELGPVNLGTLEEYEELRIHYEFLTTQQEDLNRSIAELEEAITKINISTRRRLREAFDALKVKFSEVFLALFGGGRAELVMTDENNILETGIDIIAQPPGKRLQNINLLSGGEKTFTALSLLFASFLIKPTPLCILDEADSALDELNTERFANMLQELSKDTQFIVVTHNRNTVSVADYIYGITMEEAGVSKVISMQLVEA